MKRTLVTALVLLGVGAALPTVVAADSYERKHSHNSSAHQEHRQPYPKQRLHHKGVARAKQGFIFQVHHRSHPPRHHDRWHRWRKHWDQQPPYVERQLSFKDVKYRLKDRDYRRIKKIAYRDGCYIVKAHDPYYGEKVRLTIDARTGHIVDKRYRR